MNGSRRSRFHLQMVEEAPLPHLLSVPDTLPPTDGWPLLCFLHGYDEGAPMPVAHAMMRHGPLSPSCSTLANTRFIVLAAQLPHQGDIWHRYARQVLDIVREVQTLHGANRQQAFLTGFSFGGNGVFDLALRQRDVWAALWPVEPTRVPTEDPRRPVWLSSGQVSRLYAPAFRERLDLTPPAEDATGDRIYLDQGHDHVTTATHAYQDERIYRWLLSKQLSAPVSQVVDLSHQSQSA